MFRYMDNKNWFNPASRATRENICNPAYPSCTTTSATCTDFMAFFGSTTAIESADTALMRGLSILLANQQPTLLQLNMYVCETRQQNCGLRPWKQHKTLVLFWEELNRLFKAKEDGSAKICSSSSVLRHTRRTCQVYRQGKHLGEDWCRFLVQRS